MKTMTENKKKNLAFFLMLFVFALVDAIHTFEHVISAYNTTLFAFSYDYGFTSRGLLGALYQWAERVTGLILMSYHSIYQFTELMTLVFLGFLFLFFLVCLKKTPEKKQGNIRWIIAFIGAFAFPNFWTMENFGRLDLYLMILTLMCLILIVGEKGEWLVPLLCGIAMLIHQGFVFTSAGIILMLLLYKAALGKNRRKYYGILFGLTLAFVSLLFIYFEFFGHSYSDGAYDAIVTLAKTLSEDGKSYNESIISHELLGQNVFMDEWEYHVYNYESIPFFLLLFAPFYIIGGSLLREFNRGQKGRGKLICLLASIGALTLVPEILLKVDYGRYCFYGFFYYFVLIMALLIWQDEAMERAISETKAKIKKWLVFPQMLFLYWMLLMPFYDIVISDAVDKLKVLFFPV